MGTSPFESPNGKNEGKIQTAKIVLLASITVLLCVGIIVGVLILFQNRKDDIGSAMPEPDAALITEKTIAENESTSPVLTDSVTEAPAVTSVGSQDNDVVVQTNITAYRIVSTSGSNNAAGRILAHADSRSAVIGNLYVGEIVYISAYTIGKYYHWGKCDSGWIALSANNTESTIAETYAVVDGVNYESFKPPAQKRVYSGTPYVIINTQGGNNAAGRIFREANSTSDVIGYTSYGDVYYITEFTSGKYYTWGRCANGWIALSAYNTESTSAVTYAVPW